MDVADTCSMAHYLRDDSGTDVDLIIAAYQRKTLYLSPIVITELLSAKTQNPHLAAYLDSLPRIPFKDGFWERAGTLRQKVLMNGYKAHLADVLIAQSCIDHDARLISRDRDFRHYIELGGLKVL